MTADEFDRWCVLAKDLFPGVGHYLNRVSNPVTVKRMWFHLLKEFDQPSANEALKRLFAGQAEVPRSMSELPKVVRQILTRNEPTSANPDRPMCRCLNETCGQLFRLARVCPDCESTLWEHAWKCAACEDLGVVTIWSLPAMKQLARHRKQAAVSARTPSITLPSVTLPSSTLSSAVSSTGSPPAASSPPIANTQATTTARCYCPQGQSQHWPPLTYNPNCMCLASDDLAAFLSER